MLASMFSLSWGRGEWPARASYAGVVTSTVRARSGGTPTAPILDRLTAVGAARLVLAKVHPRERQSACGRVLPAGAKPSPS
jgi:hypothetical protein